MKHGPSSRSSRASSTHKPVGGMIPSYRKEIGKLSNSRLQEFSYFYRLSTAWLACNWEMLWSTVRIPLGYTSSSAALLGSEQILSLEILVLLLFPDLASGLALKFRCTSLGSSCSYFNESPHGECRLRLGSNCRTLRPSCRYEFFVFLLFSRWRLA